MNRLKALALSLSVFAMLIFSGGTAQAAAGDWGYTTGANMRACGSTSPYAWQAPDGCVNSWLGYVDAGWRQVYCWRDGYWANGTNRWFKIRGNTRLGWISASTLPVQPSVPWCSSWNL
jgi:hypothetical protein